MTVPDSLIYSACAGIVSAPLVWIGKSLARIVFEVRATSMIVRTCEHCQKAVEQIDKATEHGI
jgi:hypothetical protein